VRVSESRRWFGLPQRLVWPADLWWPLSDDELGTAISAVHVAATAVIARSSGYRVAWLSVTMGSYPGQWRCPRNRRLREICAAGAEPSSVWPGKKRSCSTWPRSGAPCRGSGG
jgi:hypothetical protein